MYMYTCTCSNTHTKVLIIGHIVCKHNGPGGVQSTGIIGYCPVDFKNVNQSKNLSYGVHNSLECIYKFRCHILVDTSGNKTDEKDCALTTHTCRLHNILHYNYTYTVSLLVLLLHCLLVLRERERKRERERERERESERHPLLEIGYSDLKGAMWFIGKGPNDN